MYVVYERCVCAEVDVGEFKVPLGPTETRPGPGGSWQVSLLLGQRGRPGGSASYPHFWAEMDQMGLSTLSACVFSAPSEGLAQARSALMATPRAPLCPGLSPRALGRERAPTPAQGATPSPGRPGTQRGPRSRGDCSEPRIGLRRTVAAATSGPPRLGRDGPKCPAPERLMSAAAAPETQAGRYVCGASPGCAPSSADPSAPAPSDQPGQEWRGELGPR